MTPATAGKALTEEELRAYIKCSQFFHYGGLESASLETRMSKYTTEYWLTLALRSPERDREMRLTKSLLQASKLCELDTKYLAGQTEMITNGAALWMDEFFDLFPEDKYLPVTGPLPWRVRVSKTPIDLQISGILRTTQNQTLHILSFTPYKSTHSLANDPITHLKLQSMRQFVKNHASRSQAVLHLLWSGDRGRLGYNRVESNRLNNNYLKMVEAKVQDMERGNHFPVLPCRFTCPFKSNCFPGVSSA